MAAPEDLPYLDGAEGYLAEVLAAAADRSSGSDELQLAIRDWPSQYHLSCLRANLLRPLTIGPDTAVLDVGAGTGAMARYLGEVAGRVVALEGSRARAEVARIRCADQPHVEVLHGTPETAPLDPEERFDLVLLCGVLEYSGSEIGGRGGPARMLEQAVARCRPGGAVVVAIENQLGLKYLLGAPEDHRGRPWVGLEDYPGPAGVRTWSRVELRALLEAAGLAHQRWLLPFPDYKLPTVVLDEALYAEPDAAGLLDQLVGRPVQVFDGEPARLADAGAAHGVLARAGLALDVANSFLVVAGTEAGAPDRFVPGDALAWLYGSNRRAPWRRHRVLRRDRTLALVSGAEERQDGWLVQDPGGDRPFRSGTTLGQQARAAVRAHDLDGLAAALRAWRAVVDGAAVTDPVVPAGDGGGEGANPFRARPDDDLVLPGRYLDASLDNFVVEPDGTVAFVDDEWRTPDQLSGAIVRLRALWMLARDLVESGVEHPWGVDAPVRAVVDELARLAGLTVDEATVAAWRTAEHQLQHLVAAGLTDEHLAATITNPATRGLDCRPDVRRQRRLDELEAAHAAAVEELAVLRQQRDDLRDLGLRYQRRIEALEGAVRRRRSRRPHP